MQSRGVVCQLLLHRKTNLIWAVKRNGENYIFDWHRNRYKGKLHCQPQCEECKHAFFIDKVQKSACACFKAVRKNEKQSQHDDRSYCSFDSPTQTVHCKCRHFHTLMLKGYYCWPLKACLCFCDIFLEEQSWQGTVIQSEHAIRSKAPGERQSPLCHTGTSCILLSDGCQAAWQTGVSVCQGEAITVF